MTAPDKIEGYRPYHARDCPARTSWTADTCTCGGLDKPLWSGFKTSYA